MMNPQETTQPSELSDNAQSSDAPTTNSGQDRIPRLSQKAGKVEPREQREKRGWPTTTLQIATLALVPVVIAVLGGVVNWIIGQNSARQKSVELAVSILREPLKDDEKTGEVLPLRDWAVDVVNKLSEVPFSEKAGKLLRTGQKILPRTELSYSPVDGSCEVTPQIARVGEPVTFSASGAGGSGLYAFSWLGDDGLTSQNRTVTVRYHTPGQKSATVRITSNGQSIFRTATVEVTSAEEEASDP